MGSGVTRRDLLKGAGALAATAASSTVFGERMHRHGFGDRAHHDQPSFRFAFITDTHVTQNKRSPEGFAKCLQLLQDHHHAPSMIVNGGDSIYDAWGHDAAQVKEQWKLFHSVYHQNCSLPMMHAIGNHDIFGWTAMGSPSRDPQEGKQWALEELQMPNRYYSFDRGGWHFIVLDSIQQGGTAAGYIAKLDNAQFAWLERDLAATPATSPVIVVSHAPIVSACALFRPHSESPKDIRVPANWMHIDARKLKDLFLKYPNVKLCIAGHEHMHGKVDYNNVQYFSSGAVCGSWWDGPYQETMPGFAMIDLFPNGKFHAKYQPWGWAPAPLSVLSRIPAFS